MKKQKGPSDYPQAVQRRYPLPGSDLGFTNACPRDTEYDLVPVPSKTRCGMDEQTFHVTKKGNCP